MAGAGVADYAIECSVLQYEGFQLNVSFSFKSAWNVYKYRLYYWPQRMLARKFYACGLKVAQEQVLHASCERTTEEEFAYHDVLQDVVYNKLQDIWADIHDGNNEPEIFQKAWNNCPASYSNEPADRLAHFFYRVGLRQAMAVIEAHFVPETGSQKLDVFATKVMAEFEERVKQ